MIANTINPPPSPYVALFEKHLISWLFFIIAIIIIAKIIIIIIKMLILMMIIKRFVGT